MLSVAAGVSLRYLSDARGEALALGEPRQANSTSFPARESHQPGLTNSWREFNAQERSYRFGTGFLLPLATWTNPRRSRGLRITKVGDFKRIFLEKAKTREVGW